MRKDRYKKLEFQVIDPTGTVVTKDNILFEAGYGNRLLLTIGDNKYMLSHSGRLLETLNEEEPEMSPKDMIEVNGVYYPMWSQFVNQKEKWIGGILHESGDSMDRAMGMGELTTIITDIVLRPNGEKSAFFEVIGDGFSCGFDVGHGGITAGEEGWITFSGYGGHLWRIKEKEEKKSGCNCLNGCSSSNCDKR